MRRIVQFTPSIVYGDAVSNDIFAMHEVIESLNYRSEIYAYAIGKKLSATVKEIVNYVPKKTDVIIYHMSIGSEISQMVKELDVAKKIMVYHNITEARFLKNISAEIYSRCKEGREQLKELSQCMDASLSVSDYNGDELKRLGYKNVRTLPIILKMEDFKTTKPSAEIINKYNDGYANIVFVGRVAPNKKFEDVIKSFYLYNKYINAKSRLFLVGNPEGMSNYKNSLDYLIDELGVPNVIQTGKVPFPDILAYYRAAHLFLCMSEHEGFCVPLIESMLFDVPILAYESCAIPYTLGNSGVMVKEKDYTLIAETMNAILTDQKLKEELLKKQRERLAFFDGEKIKEQFKNELIRIIED